MKIKELVQKSHRMCKEKGWHDKPRTPLEVHMLIVTEVAEATEAVRNDLPPMTIQNGKPEGEAIELADAMLRIADYFGAMGWDLEYTLKVKMAYNATRPYRHGDKKA